MVFEAWVVRIAEWGNFVRLDARDLLDSPGLSTIPGLDVMNRV
jgi:hypothetical protein